MKNATVMFGSTKTMLKHREWFHDDSEKRISDYLFYLFCTGVVTGRVVNYFRVMDLLDTSTSTRALTI